jgi:crotonobetainyl-CoA:carnitine CoA-transferase CaiB-like acyl-CoA transferase
VASTLLSQADVFVESLRPGAAERLGLGWSELVAVNPRLVYLSLNAFGDVGPLAGRPGFDAILQAYTGLMDVTGYPEAPPARIGTGIVDFGTGLWAALSVIGGLLQREHTNRGCRLESTLLGSAMSFMMHHIASAGLAGVVPGRIGTAQHNSAPYEAVSAQDGMLMLGVANDGLWRRLVSVIDDGRLAKDDRFATNRDRVQHRDEIVQLIGDLLADRSKEDVVAELSRNGIPASVIRRVDAMLDDPQVEALELIQRTSSGMRLPVAPIRCDGAVPNLADDPPPLGGSTTRFLTECGFTAPQIAELIQQEVVNGPAHEG